LKTRRIVEVRQDDFHIKRFSERSETVTIFVVDASGSSALHRLAEAKGAVELLLADCYVRRDQVAVLAFGGRGAQLLLPPTRSLARAKRHLADLPGGGGTPLAAALDEAAQLAHAIRRKHQTPSIVLLTDGQPNLARDGRSGRQAGEEDALAAASQLRESGFAALLIDTSPQTKAAGARIAEAMGAHYVPLPQADAIAVSEVVRAGIGGSGA
jgi:magnesium chelatase subunit D